MESSTCTNKQYEMELIIKALLLSAINILQPFIQNTIT